MTASTQRGGPVQGGTESVHRRNRRGRLGAWFTSVSGVLASVATIVAALASVLAAHQTTRVNQLTIVVRQQQQIKQAQHASKAQQASGSTIASGASGGASGQGSAYLSALEPTVRLNISAVTQLAVTCTGLNTQNQQSANGYDVTLGNAQIS